MSTIRCETLAIVISGQGKRITYTLPAYTVEADGLRRRVNDLVDGYISMSEQADTGMSLADFVLLAIRVASDDPRFMEEA